MTKNPVADPTVNPSRPLRARSPRFAPQHGAWASDQGGVSAVLGEILLLFSFVAVGGVLFVAFTGIEPPRDQQRSLVSAVASCGLGGWATGDEVIRLVHQGGEAFNQSRLSVRLTLDGTSTDHRPDALGLPPTRPFFQIGDELRSSPLTLGVDANLGYALIYRADASGQVLEDRAIDRFECGLQPEVGGSSTSGFGALPFQDRNCNFRYDEGVDQLIPPPELSSGYYETPPGVCFVVPPGVGDVSAQEVRFVSPGGGIRLGVNLTARTGDVVLDAPGGILRIDPGIRLTAEGGIELRGAGTIDLAGALLDAQRQSVLIDSGGGPINATGAQITAGAGLDPNASVPVIDLPDQSGPGSIRICVVLVDAMNRVTNGWQFIGQTFTESGVPAPPGYTAEGILPSSTFRTPLALNADILFEDGRVDAECRTYNDLEVGHWYYGEESLSPRSGWQVPRYNDQFTNAIRVLSDFHAYSPELFTPDPNDDGRRNQNADGDIHLTNGRPFRTLGILNQFNTTRAAEIDVRSRGADIDLTDARLLAYDSDVRIDSSGGRILGLRLRAEARGDQAQVQLLSAGGMTDVGSGRLTSLTGRIALDSGSGPVVAVGTTMTAQQNVDATGGGGIDVRQASVTSTHADIVLNVVHTSATVQVQDARFDDRNDRAAIRPTGARVVGTPAFGGTE